jgi:hypothetical protein
MAEKTIQISAFHVMGNSKEARKEGRNEAAIFYPSFKIILRLVKIFYTDIGNRSAIQT